VPIETDVHTSKDGVVFISHDPVVVENETHDSPRAVIKETHSEDLLNMDLDAKREIYFGCTHFEAPSKTVSKLATLEELFQRVQKDHVIHIDIKDAANPVSCFQVRKLVEKY